MPPKTLKSAAEIVKDAIKAVEAEKKTSEALSKVEGKTLMVTESDRTKVGQGYLGGPGFSSLQLTDPAYRDVGAVWGVAAPGKATTILNASRRVPEGQHVFTTMVGSPTQHRSNQQVFNKLLDEFRASAREGNLSDELRGRINDSLRSAINKEGNPIFAPNVDIMSPKFRKQANTFERRAVAADLIAGEGIGGKKGQIIDFDKVMRRTTDPMLLDVPTGSMGPRLFTLSGETIQRPDLHPAFPSILTGEDLGVAFQPAPIELMFRDYVKNLMETKGRKPGYMDITRGHGPKQFISEDLLTEMQKAGYAKGGSIDLEAEYRMGKGGLLKKAVKAVKEAIQPTAPRDEALRTAQKNAAKPVSEGGLGLRPDNTAMERARAMGYTTEAYKGMHPYDSSSGEIWGVKDGRFVPVANIGAEPEVIRSIDPARTSKMELGGRHSGFYGGKDIANAFAGYTSKNSAVFPVLLNMGKTPEVFDGAGKYAGSFQFERPASMNNNLDEYKRFQRAFFSDAPSSGAVIKNTTDEGTIFVPKEGRQARSRFAAFDPARIDENDLLAGFAALGITAPMLTSEEPDEPYAKGGLIKSLVKAIGKELPEAKASQKTQIPGTEPTYRKAYDILEREKPGGRTLDYGAGLGHGSRLMGAESFEPFPREGFSPTFIRPEDIPTEEFDRLVNLNVLNVLPRDVRDATVENIGRVMRPGGMGIVTTRGRDVLNAAGEAGPEPMSKITSIGTYQKGFSPEELREYLTYMLGKDYDISRLNLGPAGAMVRKKGKAEGGAVLMKRGGKAKGETLASMDTGKVEMGRAPGAEKAERILAGAAEFIPGVAAGKSALEGEYQKALIEAGLDVAGGPLAKGLGAAIPAVAGIFIGPKSKLWNEEKRREWARLINAGVDEKEAYQKTGTFMGADGYVRQEISDQSMKMRSPEDLARLMDEKSRQAQALKASMGYGSKQRDLFPKELTEARKRERPRLEGLEMDIKDLERDPESFGVPARLAVDHPKLFEAYPELGDVMVRQNVDLGPGVYGSASLGVEPKISLADPRLLNKEFGAPEDTMIHELQHMVQKIEGFEGGSSAQDAINMVGRARVKELMDQGVPKMDALDQARTEFKGRAGELYNRMAGEAEARAVEARRPMSSDELLQNFPPEQQYRDVYPYEEQLMQRDYPPVLLYNKGGPVKMAKGGDLEEEYNLRKMGMDPTRVRGGYERKPLSRAEIQAMMLDVPAGLGVPFAEAGAYALRGETDEAKESAAIEAALMGIPAAAVLAKPAYRAVKKGVQKAAPAVREAAYEALESAMESGVIPDPRMQAIAYHGSPHRFEKFDASKIGTGEGAQAYGHGIYFAESPDVADQYAGKLSKPLVTTAAGFSVNNTNGLSEAAKNVLKKMQEDAEIAQYGYRNELASRVLDRAPASVKKELVGDAPPWKEVVVTDSGSLYTVDIPDESVARMLDWDKPLSEQSPEVRGAIENTKSLLPESAMADLGDDLSLLYGPDVTPNQFLNTWEALAGNVGAGERALRESGVPGIKYLDQASRGAGEGTRNFVVFPGEEETVKILERKKRGGAVIMKSGGKVKSAADMFHAKGHQALMDFDNKTKKRKG